MQENYTDFKEIIMNETSINHNFRINLTGTFAAAPSTLFYEVKQVSSFKEQSIHLTPPIFCTI